MKCTRWQFTQADLIENAISTDKLNKRRLRLELLWFRGAGCGNKIYNVAATPIPAHSVSLNFSRESLRHPVPQPSADCYQVQTAQKFPPKKTRAPKELLLSQPTPPYVAIIIRMWHDSRGAGAAAFGIWNVIDKQAGEFA